LFHVIKYIWFFFAHLFGAISLSSLQEIPELLLDLSSGDPVTRTAALSKIVAFLESGTVQTPPIYAVTEEIEERRGLSRVDRSAGQLE
jgi:hypothetical protein